MIKSTTFLFPQNAKNTIKTGEDAICCYGTNTHTTKTGLFSCPARDSTHDAHNMAREHDTANNK